jgi:di/tricarboxylate transporter
LITNLGVFGEIGILAGVVLATVALTELVTNNAAALLMFPIAITAAAAAGVDPRGMAVAVAIAASASFLTPLGYQTNTMVYGPGGYRVGHYVRVGLPITIIAVVGIVALVPIFY